MKVCNEITDIFEKSFADFKVKKGKFKHLTNKEIEKTKSPGNDLTDELFKLIDTSYDEIGGHIDFKKPSDIPFDHNKWKMVNIDDDPAPDIAFAAKDKAGFGDKSTVTATDGSKKAAKIMLMVKEKDLNTRGNYAEISGKLANALLKRYDIPVVTDPEVIAKVLGKNKPFEMVGFIPRFPKDKFPKAGGWYKRSFGSKSFTKLLVGTPAV